MTVVTLLIGKGSITYTIMAKIQHTPRKGVKMASAAVQHVMERLVKIEFDREEDGRWIAEVPELSGVIVYGDTKDEARLKVQALALRVLADVAESEHIINDTVRFAVA